jgi:pimeloyl-ACP methyl ester carboxylesterase
MTGGLRALRARGHLAPDAMFPAGAPDIRVRHVALSGGLTLRVAEAGSADAPPMLLLHGWGASIYMWRAWFAPLAAAGFRAVAVDLPGHGLSGKPDEPSAYSLDGQVAMLRELLAAEHLMGARVVAQSMGASIALELAMREPATIGPLALINPSSFGRVRAVALAKLVSPPFVDTTVAHLVPRWIVARVHRRVYAQPSRITPRDVDEYWAPSQLAGHARALWCFLHEFRWERAPAERMAERLRGLERVPLVLLGGRDALVRDARPYAAALVRAGAPLEVVELAEGGHAMNEEQPQVVMKLVLEWLGRNG